MTRISAVLLVLALFSGALPAMAADGDTRTCSLIKAIECTPEEGCADWSIPDLDLPRFVRIDLKANTITSLDKTVARTSKISSVERLQGLIIMHGTEARGWTMLLKDDTGDLTLSAAGEKEGFVVFGSCIAP